MKERVETFLASPAATTMVGWMTLGTVLLFITLAFITVPGIISNTEASRRTDELNTCRASYRADIDRARFVRDDAVAVINIITADAVVSRQDIFAVEAAAEALAEAKLDLVSATADMNDAVLAYDEANDLSQTDPGLFLTQCQESAP